MCQQYALYFQVHASTFALDFQVHGPTIRSRLPDACVSIRSRLSRACGSIRSRVPGAWANNSLKPYQVTMAGLYMYEHVMFTSFALLCAKYDGISPLIVSRPSRSIEVHLNSVQCEDRTPILLRYIWPITQWRHSWYVDFDLSSHALQTPSVL